MAVLYGQSIASTGKTGPPWTLLIREPANMEISVVEITCGNSHQPSEVPGSSKTVVRASLSPSYTEQIISLKKCEVLAIQAETTRFLK